METTPDLQVYDLGHLGLVASIVDRIGLVPLVDERVGPRPGEKVSTGVALKAALLNALGFVTSPLYLFGHYWEGKPTEWLLGEGITPELLNDDRMGRMLDSLYQAGVTELFLEVAKRARQAFPFPVRALHADATSFHVHGRYKGTEEEARAIRIAHGYSRDHRPDLKQWAMNLICADTGGIPLLFAPGDGNQSDQEALVPLLARYRQGLDLGEVVVLQPGEPGGSAGVLLGHAGAGHPKGGQGPATQGGTPGGLEAPAARVPGAGGGEDVRGCAAALAVGGEPGAGQDGGSKPPAADSTGRG